MSIENHKSGAGKSHPSDYTLYMPDDCLASIFQSLLPRDDRERCSLVCRRWLMIEGQTHRRLSLSLKGYAQQSNLVPYIPSIFARFNFITELSLKGEGLLGNKALILISLQCKNLTRLTLHDCKITADGVKALLKNCARLKMLSFRCTSFGGARGMNTILDNCNDLEELHLERLRDRESIGSGAAASSLKFISLEDINMFNAKLFARLIKSSKSLRTLKMISLGFTPLGMLLQCMADSVTEIHMEDVDVSDLGLSAISICCPNLEIFRLVKFFGNCSNARIVMIAERCKSLKTLHMNDSWSRGGYNYHIWDEGLMAVAKNCPNLEELLLDGVSVTQLSLGMLGANCVKLERLTLCGGRTVTDAELNCIAANCSALKKLRIEYCPAVSNGGIQALASGCPNLAQVMFKECKALTLKGVQRLRASRASLVVDFDKVGRGRGEAPAKRLLILS